MIAALPTTILALMDKIEEKGKKSPPLKVRLVLFAGEAMHPDQREQVKRAIPGAEIRSIGYASTDAGLLGYADPSCGPNEFRRHDGAAIYEILDEETHEPIAEAGVPGRAVMTDLHRFLMPVIRYPVGDRAQWVDPPGTPDRKFLLLGRSEESARVGPLSLYFDDLRSLLEGFKDRLGAYQFQLVIEHQNLKDRLRIRIATRTQVKELKPLAIDIIQTIHQNRPVFRDFVKEGKIHPIEIEWTQQSSLEINARSGKLKRIIDRRLETNMKESGR